MAGIAQLYGNLQQVAFSKGIDWMNDQIRVALLDGSYLPDQDAHKVVADLAGELSGGGYARVTLAGKSTVYDGPSNTLTLTAADLVFPALTGTFRFAVIFADTGSADTSPLVGYTDFGQDVEALTQDVTLTVPVTGIVQWAIVA